MTRINLLRKATTYDKGLSSYRLNLEVLSTENIPRAVFLKQRIRNFIKNNFDDVFAAVTTPAQIEDFDEDSPGTDSSYFRVYNIELISRNAAYLEDVFESVLVELQKLVDDYEAIQSLEPDAIYTISSASSIQVNTSIVHTHYRLPLTAEPAGDNETFTEADVDYHRVAAQDTDKPGWLNCISGDPLGYKFKYNIAQDTALSAIWPPSADKISFAHLEVEGITTEEVLITSAGVFWKGNELGDAPWPFDYVSPLNTSPSGETLRLVLDLIV